MSEDEMSEVPFSPFIITEVWVFNVGFPVVNAFNLKGYSLVQ